MYALFRITDTSLQIQHVVDCYRKLLSAGVAHSDVNHTSVKAIASSMQPIFIGFSSSESVQPHQQILPKLGPLFYEVRGNMTLASDFEQGAIISRILSSCYPIANEEAGLSD